MAEILYCRPAPRTHRPDTQTEAASHWLEAVQVVAVGAHRFVELEQLCPEGQVTPVPHVVHPSVPLMQVETLAPAQRVAPSVQAFVHDAGRHADEPFVSTLQV